MSLLAERAPLLFIGMVVRAETLACCERFADVTFRVKKAWKGVGLTSVTLRTGAGCGRPFPFAIGREYLVAAVDSADQSHIYRLYIEFRPIDAKEAQNQIRDLDEWLRIKADPPQ
jgi:hypothetical protein